MKDKELREEVRKIKRNLYGLLGTYDSPAGKIGMINQLTEHLKYDISQIKETQRLILNYFKLIQVTEPEKQYLTTKEAQYEKTEN